MLRLVAYAPNGVQRYPLGNGDLIIGSADECDICLPFSGVAKRHARIRRSGVGAEIEDLGSRRDTLLNGERVKQASLRVLDEVRLGKVTLLLEDVAPQALAPELVARPKAVAQAAEPDQLLRHIAAISDWVTLDTESRKTIESVIAELISEFGGGACFLFQGEPDELPGTKFAAVTETRYLEGAEELAGAIHDEGLEEGVGQAREIVWQGRKVWSYSRRFSVLDRSYLMIFALPHFSASEWSPTAGLGIVSDLLVLGLVHHVGRFEPILPGHDGHVDLTLAEGLVVGNSVRTLQLLMRCDQCRPRKAVFCFQARPAPVASWSHARFTCRVNCGMVRSLRLHAKELRPSSSRQISSGLRSRAATAQSGGNPGSLVHTVEPSSWIRSIGCR